MNILILAGGFGTRMYPLTLNTPKALLEIKNKPVIEYLFEKINEIKNVEEIKGIYILSNNKFYINFLEWLNKFRNEEKILSEKIKIINNGVNDEMEKNGAIGDLKYAFEFIGNEEDIFVFAADNLFEFNLNSMINLFYEKKSSVIALKIIDDSDLIKKYSCVLQDESGKIIFFEEKPESPQSNICSVGCYYITDGDIKKIQNHEFSSRDNLGLMIEFLHKKSNIYGISFDEFWTDVSLEELEKLNA